MDYRTITNRVLAKIRHQPITEAGFADPPEPAATVKNLVNEAKDETLIRLRRDLFEDEYRFFTDAPLNPDTSITHTKATETQSNLTVSNWPAGAGVLDDEYKGWKIKLDNRPGILTVLAVPFGSPIVDPVEQATFASQPGFWFKDTYEIGDTSIRQVIAASISRGASDSPATLDLVSEPFVLDRDYPMEYELNIPQKIAIFRSKRFVSDAQTDRRFWQVQLWPPPDDVYMIHLKVRSRVVDLVNATDEWNLEDEIVHQIIDTAVVKAAMSYVQNDPEFGLALQQRVDKNLDLIAEQQQPSSARRYRRRGPDEAAQELPLADRRVTTT